MFEVEDFHWWYVSLHDLIIATVKEKQKSCDDMKILDAGCGTGRLCQLLQNFGSVSGCDISEKAIDLCRERGLTAIFQADLNNVQLRASNYDIITSIDTLYHIGITDELAVLERFYHALKPGGLLIINLVAHEFLRSSHDIAVQTRKRYNKNQVKTLLEKSGFDIICLSYRLGFLFLPIALLRLAKRLLCTNAPPELTPSDVTPPTPFINRLLLWMARQENRLVLRSMVHCGTSVFAVVKKPETLQTGHLSSPA